MQVFPDVVEDSAVFRIILVLNLDNFRNLLFWKTLRAWILCLQEKFIQKSGGLAFGAQGVKL